MYVETKSNNVVWAWRLLYITYGIVPIVAGADKYLNLLTNWTMYLDFHIPKLLHLSPTMFMYGVGIIEIIAGFLVLLAPQIGGYVVATWLIAIAANLVMLGSKLHLPHGMYYDIAVRDVAMAVGAYVLVLLTKEMRKKP